MKMNHLLVDLPGLAFGYRVYYPAAGRRGPADDFLLRVELLTKDGAPLLNLPIAWLQEATPVLLAALQRSAEADCVLKHHQLRVRKK